MELITMLQGVVAAGVVVIVLTLAIEGASS